MRKIIPFLFLIALMSSCTNSNNNRIPGQPYTDFEGENGNGIKKIYNAEGKLETEVPYKDSLPNGIQKEYYKTGQLYRETPFEKGKAIGVVKEYSTSGKIYREMPVVDGKANGIIKKYYPDGKLFSEAPFENGKPVAGLKEYDEKGNLIARPKMVFNVRNQKKGSGTAIVEVSLSDEYIQPDYFQILVFENKEMQSKLPSANGKGILKISIPAGTIISKTLTFEARYTTSRNNVCIIRDSYNLTLN